MYFEKKYFDEEFKEIKELFLKIKKITYHYEILMIEKRFNYFIDEKNYYNILNNNLNDFKRVFGNQIFDNNITNNQYYIFLNNFFNSRIQPLNYEKYILSQKEIPHRNYIDEQYKYFLILFFICYFLYLIYVFLKRFNNTTQIEKNKKSSNILYEELNGKYNKLNKIYEELKNNTNGDFNKIYYLIDNYFYSHNI